MKLVKILLLLLLIILLKSTNVTTADHQTDPREPYAAPILPADIITRTPSAFSSRVRSSTALLAQVLLPAEPSSPIPTRRSNSSVRHTSHTPKESGHTNSRKNPSPIFTIGEPALVPTDSSRGTTTVRFTDPLITRAFSPIVPTSPRDHRPIIPNSAGPRNNRPTMSDIMVTAMILAVIYSGIKSVHTRFC